jgi:integral membrane protein (TIGR01906 family)
MWNFIKLPARIFLCGLIPLWILIGSVRLVASDTFLLYEYNKLDFPQDSYGFSPDQRLSYASLNLTFVRNDRPISVLEIQKSGENPLYNERELSHMIDVQNVYQVFAFLWTVVTALILITFVLLYIQADIRKDIPLALKLGGLITTGFIVTIGLMALIGWDTWFALFHKLFFAAGSWTFNYSDTLIRLFPQKFWMDAVFTVSGLSALGGMLVGLAGWRWQKMITNRQKSV